MFLRPDLRPGAPPLDASPAEVRPDSEPVGDRDDPDHPMADQGVEPAVDAGQDGRDGAPPGPVEPPPDPMLVGPFGPDPRRCDGDDAYIPPLDRCLSARRVDDLPADRAGHAALPLLDGQVLVVGGFGASLSPVDVLGGTAVYAPAEDRWHRGPVLLRAVSEAALIALDDGTALVLGGRGEVVEARVQRVLPEAGGCEEAGALATARRGGVSLPFGDSVVVIGGRRRDGQPLGAELFDLDEKSEPLGPMGVPRAEHVALRTPMGEALAFGGRDASQRVRFAPERLDARSREWVAVPGPAEWAFAEGAAASVPDGVIFAGGVDEEGHWLQRAGRLDPVTGRWEAVGGLMAPRAGLTLTPIGGAGAALAFGAGDDEPAVELYVPEGRRFVTARVPAEVLADRIEHAASALPDGAVLISGGQASGRPVRHVVRLALYAPREVDPMIEREE
ncbi:MAG: hypothetical protein KC620_12565 [Myxococcales bacterium]|nr:hypothetical protein [Myxococcales bacterium]